MATNLVKVTETTPIVWADLTDYSSTVSGLTRTAQIDLTSVASGAARQGDKVDFGATRHSRYVVFMAIEIASLAASDEEIVLYLSGSPHATAGNANPGGASGADSAYTGTAGDSIADSVKQLQRIGSLVTTADNTPTVQYQKIATVEGDDLMRYNSPVLVDNSSGALMTDAVEMFIAFIPINPDIQAAV